MNLEQTTATTTTTTMSLSFEYGDIISDYCDSNKNLIMQQNNCTATKVNRQFFALKLSEKLAYSDPYKDRRQGRFPILADINDRPKPGSIILYDMEIE